MFKKLILIYVAFAFIPCTATFQLHVPNLPIPRENLKHTEVRWDWNQIEPIQVKDLHFPSNFIWGTATSGHQVDGNSTNQWIRFENRTDWLGENYIEQSGDACDHWNRYKDDIQLIKNLGIKAYRFSIEWGRIEPKEGSFNQDAINHYHDLIDHLIANDITPVITLHHFTHPQWFEDKHAFEKEANIPYFVRYCTKMFEEYSDKVPMWCTINEPGVVAFQGYVRGDFPPSKKSLELAGIVSKNLILSHIKAYKAMKAMPNGKQCQIGITHSITIFDPHNPNNKLECWLASSLNHVFYDAMLQFFVTGKFSYKAPKILGLFLAGNPFMMLLKPTSAFPLVKTEWHSTVEFNYEDMFNEKYRSYKVLDFFGIQPYSHVLVDISNTQADKKPTRRDGDILTDMPYVIYPEIIERAVNVASFVGVPIYITENGIADDKDDRRELYIRRNLYAVSEVLKKGYDVRGYFYWSLMDNFEWNLGYGKKFGLYEVDFKTQQRTPRNSAFYYKQVIAEHTKY